MIQKIEKSLFLGNHGIQVLYPGRIFSAEDTGIGSIGRIDYANFKGETFIKMHPHINDEILSYFRVGQALHRDSEGISEIVGEKKLMLMKAGKIFHHEERISGDGEKPFEGLQIFIRPKEKDLTPEVSFFDLEEKHQRNSWRLLASPTDETPLKFSSQSWVFDTLLTAGNRLSLPEISPENKVFLLFVFGGEIKVGEEILTKQEGLIIQNETIEIQTHSQAELVLFITDLSAKVCTKGMFSGNQMASFGNP